MQLPAKIYNLATDANQKQWTQAVTSPGSGESKPTQTMKARRIANIQIQSNTFPDPQKPGSTIDKQLIHLDLNGSEFGCGDPFLSQKDMCGFFVEWLHYKAWVQDPGLPWAPENAHPDWTIVQETPTTPNSDGSITSSISFGFDGSVGSFAGDPTASVGGSMSVSSSHSHTIKDYTFFAKSDLRVMTHWLQMTQCGDGAPYKGARDLVDTDGGGIFSAFGAKLRPLPAIATSNLPLVSQVVWMNQSDAGLVSDLLVCVQMFPHYLLTEATSYGAEVEHKNLVEDYMWIRTNPVNFDVLKR